LYDIFLNTQQNLLVHHFDVQVYNWHEYGAYTGILPLLLFILGVLLFWKREPAILITGLIFLFLSIGDFARESPWRLLHSLPIFSSVRLSSRLIIIFVFCLAIFAGLAFGWMCKKTQRSIILKRFLFLLVILIVANLFLVNGKPFTKVFEISPPIIERNKEFSQGYDYVYPHNPIYYSTLYSNFLSNNGTLNAYDPVPHPAFAILVGDPSYKGEVYLELEGNASYEYWSPNKLIVNVETLKSNRVVINQNYDRGWRVKGGQAESFNGLLSAHVTESDKKIKFYYLPSSFVKGAIISILSVVGTISFLIFKEKMPPFLSKSF